MTTSASVGGNRALSTAAAAQDAALRRLKGVARCLPTGVAVLTVAHEGTVHAATVSTVSTVSQEPLTLAVSLRAASLFAKFAVDSGCFAVNVLTSRQALLADWFASPQRPSGERQFDLVDWRLDPVTGIPLLGGTLAHLMCQVTAHVPVGTADAVLVAEVTAGRRGAGRPLVNFDGELYDADLSGVVRRPGWRSPASAAPLWD